VREAVAHLHPASRVPLGRLPGELVVLPEGLLAERGQTPHADAEVDSDLRFQFRKLPAEERLDVSHVWV
jgi:hypothetical protein